MDIPPNSTDLPVITGSPVVTADKTFEKPTEPSASTEVQPLSKATNEITADDNNNDSVHDNDDDNNKQQDDHFYDASDVQQPSPQRDTNPQRDTVEDGNTIARQTSPFHSLSRNGSINRPFGPRHLELTDTLPSRSRKMVRFDSSTQVIQFEALTPEMAYSFSDSRGEDEDEEEDTEDADDDDEEENTDAEFNVPVIEPPTVSRPLPQIPLDIDNFGFLRSERRGSDPTERSILDAYEADVSEYEPATPVNDSVLRSPTFENQFSTLRFDEPHNDAPQYEPEKQARDVQSPMQSPTDTTAPEKLLPMPDSPTPATRVKTEPVEPVGLGLDNMSSIVNLDTVEEVKPMLFPDNSQVSHPIVKQEHDKVSPVPSLDRALSSPSTSCSPMKHEPWIYDSLGRSSIADEFAAEFDFGDSVPVLSHPAMDKLTEFPDSRQTSPEPDALDIRLGLPPLKSNTFNGMDKEKHAGNITNTFNGMESQKSPVNTKMTTEDAYTGSTMPSSLAGLFQDNPYRLSLDLGSFQLDHRSRFSPNRFSMPDVGRHMSPATNSDDEDDNDDSVSETSQPLPRASAGSAVVEPTMRSSSRTQARTRPSLTPLDVAKIQQYRVNGEGLADEQLHKPMPLLALQSNSSSEDVQNSSMFGDIDEEFDKLVHKSRGYTLRQDKHLVIARSDTPRQTSASRKISGPVKRVTSDSNIGRQMSIAARAAPGLPDVKEYESLPNTDRGRLFVRIVSLTVDLPAIEDKRAKFSLTLDNGIHCITTQSVPLKKRTLLDEEFELTVNDHLEFILTMKAKWTKPLGEKNIAARSPPRPLPRSSVPLAPVASKASGMSEKRGFAAKLFGRKTATTNSKQLGTNLGAIAGAAGGTTRAGPTAAASPSPAPAKDPWDTLVAADGSFARAYIDFSQYEKEVYGRPATFELACFNEWVKSSTGKKVAPYKIGSAQVQLMYVPRANKNEALPGSIKEALSELKIARQRIPVRRQGFLSQLGGDCKYWRRRYFILDGPVLIAHSESSRKARATINLSKAVSVVQANQETMGHDGFQVKFANGETIDFTGSETDVDEWMASMSEVIGDKKYSPWADLVLRNNKATTTTTTTTTKP